MAPPRSFAQQFLPEDCCVARGACEQPAGCALTDVPETVLTESALRCFDHYPQEGPQQAFNADDVGLRRASRSVHMVGGERSPAVQQHVVVELAMERQATQTTMVVYVPAARETSEVTTQSDSSPAKLSASRLDYGALDMCKPAQLHKASGVHKPCRMQFHAQSFETFALLHTVVASTHPLRLRMLNEQTARSSFFCVICQNRVCSSRDPARPISVDTHGETWCHALLNTSRSR